MGLNFLRNCVLKSSAYISNAQYFEVLLLVSIVPKFHDCTYSPRSKGSVVLCEIFFPFVLLALYFWHVR